MSSTKKDLNFPPKLVENSNFPPKSYRKQNGGLHMGAAILDPKVKVTWPCTPYLHPLERGSKLTSYTTLDHQSKFLEWFVKKSTDSDHNSLNIWIWNTTYSDKFEVLWLGMSFLLQFQNMSNFQALLGFLKIGTEIRHTFLKNRHWN